MLSVLPQGYKIKEHHNAHWASPAAGDAQCDAWMIEDYSALGILGLRLISWKAILLNDTDKSFPFVLAPVFRVMNQLEQEGFFTKYVMGGSMALMFYSEPFFTDDVDFFCYLPQQGLLSDLGPIYMRLAELGFKPSGLYVIIEGVQVQFLAPDSPLLDEAMDTAVGITMGGVSTRIFQLEYALAIKAQANRKKDWKHIITALDSAEVDTAKLETILAKFGILEEWRRRIDD